MPGGRRPPGGLGQQSKIDMRNSISLKDLGKHWFHVSSKSGNTKNWVLMSIYNCCPSPPNGVCNKCVGDLEAIALKQTSLSEFAR